MTFRSPQKPNQSVCGTSSARRTSSSVGRGSLTREAGHGSPGVRLFRLRHQLQSSLRQRPSPPQSSPQKASPGRPRPRHPPSTRQPWPPALWLRRCRGLKVHRTQWRQMLQHRRFCQGRPFHRLPTSVRLMPLRRLRLLPQLSQGKPLLQLRTLPWTLLQWLRAGPLQQLQTVLPKCPSADPLPAAPRRRRRSVAAGRCPSTRRASSSCRKMRRASAPIMTPRRSV
mmetsp:Transcript_25621/g.74061  ORF Transcript_25621/g.74061 Transcript_25621/m.74061 type:complete len:226 (+) Transcript_25621:381-1058(+)